MIRVKRVYDPPDPADGVRVLVDRVWPRGLKRTELQLDYWFPEVAPSSPLRKWFGHDPTKWEEFRQRYQKELESEEKKGVLTKLLHWAKSGSLTLLYSARDPKHNQALVLRDFLRQKLERGNP